MIYETSFLECENVPEEMSCRFDQPWHFIGEVRAEDRAYMQISCQKCNGDRQALSRIDHTATFTTLLLRRRLFITDDRIEVYVYFGVCERCDSVYWGRSGPP